MAGRLMRRTSPSTRIIGGKPDDRCRSDAPCLALKASSSVISMGLPNHKQAGRMPGPDGPAFRARVMSTIEEMIAKVRARIREAAQAAQRDPAAVGLLAVSKTQPAARSEEHT